jgi:uncharacterized protein YbaR (Trm112 family)
MAIHPDLLEILACPRVQDARGARPGRRRPAVAASASAIYPVREDIPIMLPEEATASE